MPRSDWFEDGRESRLSVRNKKQRVSLDISKEDSDILLKKGEVKLVMKASYLGNNEFKIINILNNEKSILNKFFKSNPLIKADSYKDLIDYLLHEHELKGFNFDSFMGLNKTYTPEQELGSCMGG